MEKEVDDGEEEKHDDGDHGKLITQRKSQSL